MNGGPAFPAMHFDLGEDEHGMTLRDYFAAKAMQGIITTNSHFVKDAAALANKAYEFSDAMLKERDK